MAASADGGLTWSDIPGATATSYTPPAGSAGKQVRVLVTGTNGDGSSQATSPASAVILANPPVNTVAPSLSGTAQDGVAMTAAKGTWTGVATITYTYQWQLSADGGLTWSDIAGATATTYTPPAGSAGKQVRVLVTGTNGDGNSQAASPASAVILAEPARQHRRTQPLRHRQGRRRNAPPQKAPGPASRPSPTPTNGSSPTDGGATWTDIAGATATTYTPPAGIGRQTGPRRSSPAPTATARAKPPHPQAQSSSPTHPSTPSHPASPAPPKTASQ